MESAYLEPARDTAWAMSQENVDQFMRCIEAFDRFDIPGVLRLLDPEIQFEHRLTELEGSAVGLEAVERLLADVAEHFDALKVECPDVRDLGDRVLALGTSRITGKGSGVETELPFTVVARFRDGRMTHFTDFGDTDLALEAAGLRSNRCHRGTWRWCGRCGRPMASGALTAS